MFRGKRAHIINILKLLEIFVLYFKIYIVKSLKFCFLFAVCDEFKINFEKLLKFTFLLVFFKKLF